MARQSSIPTNSDLLQAIQASLGSITASITLSSSAIWDLYEAYIFSIIVGAAKDAGGRVQLQVSDALPGRSHPATELMFRRAPGSLRVTRMPYTFAAIDFDNKDRLEAHVGVYIVGKSGIPHEADVVVLKSSSSVKAQQNNVEPKASEIQFAAECKFYTSSLGLDLARSFIGLTVDASRDKWYFITNITSSTVNQLLEGNSRNWEHKIVPSSPGDVGRLRSAFHKAFENYIASNK